MRIARYEDGGAERLGIVAGDVVEPLDPAVSLDALLAADPAQRDTLAVRSEAPRPLAEIALLAPLRPPSVRDFMTFEEHLEGALKAANPDATIAPEWYEAPRFYFTNPHAIVATGAPVPVPPGARLFDFELEVAAVIGRPGRDLTPEQAREHIAGYTIFNDWSARDLQGNEMRVGLGPAKGKDTATTLGPWIVTADELEPHRRDDRLHLELAVDLNGERIGDDTLANMAWSFEDMVAYASRGTWVQTGDVLGSGTCGTGCLLELWGRQRQPPLPPLTAGDEVTLHVEGIGSVTNRIVDGAEPVAIPAARPVERRRRPWNP